MSDIYPLSDENEIWQYLANYNHSEFPKLYNYVTDKLKSADDIDPKVILFLLEQMTPPKDKKQRKTKTLRELEISLKFCEVTKLSKCEIILKWLDSLEPDSDYEKGLKDKYLTAKEHQERDPKHDKTHFKPLCDELLKAVERIN